jgi:hypothetical protein
VGMIKAQSTFGLGRRLLESGVCINKCKRPFDETAGASDDPWNRFPQQSLPLAWVSAKVFTTAQNSLLSLLSDGSCFPPGNHLSKLLRGRPRDNPQKNKDLPDTARHLP